MANHESKNLFIEYHTTTKEYFKNFYTAIGSIAFLQHLFVIIDNMLFYS